jgi:hypothetical protein
LLIVIGVAGLIAVRLDAALMQRIQKRGCNDRVVHFSLLGMAVAWLLLPLFVIGLGYVLPAAAFVAFPMSIGLGVLLLLVRGRLRQGLGYVQLPSRGRRLLDRISAVLILVVTLFWATSNYAEVLGNQIADRLTSHVNELTSVTVYSPTRLAITAPGSQESAITGANQAYRYRYTGLRLYEHTSGRYFLISDGWNPEEGVVIVLPASESIRLEFSQ